MKEYKVFLREPARPNVIQVKAASAQEARKILEAQGKRVRAVSPRRF